MRKPSSVPKSWKDEDGEQNPQHTPYFRRRGSSELLHSRRAQKGTQHQQTLFSIALKTQQPPHSHRLTKFGAANSLYYIKPDNRTPRTSRQGAAARIIHFVHLSPTSRSIFETRPGQHPIIATRLPEEFSDTRLQPIHL